MQPRNNDIYSENNLEQNFLLSSSQTTLQRTELTSQDKVLFCANALAREHEHGSKSVLARQFEVSRPTVYSAIGTACSVLSKHFDGHKSKTGDRSDSRCLLYIYKMEKCRGGACPRPKKTAIKECYRRRWRKSRR
jgi:hypothetical protein